MRVPNNPAWSASVRLMRILCPLGSVLSAGVTYLDYRLHSPWAILAAICIGTNMMLTWIQWAWLEP